MTGYLVRLKNLYYYKCNTKHCKVNRNATLLHKSWEQSLTNFQLDPNYTAPIIEQWKRTLEGLQDNSGAELKALRKSKTQVEQKLGTLEERYVLGKIKGDLYEKYAAKYRTELIPFVEEIAQLENPLSNPDKLIENVADLLCNLHKTWQLSKVDGKSKLLLALYPQGVLPDVEKTIIELFV
ncbi:MAG: site-specific DNA recombinase [Bacteroidia bacterium]|jgi:site-specific DNA recombinase